MWMSKEEENKTKPTEVDFMRMFLKHENALRAFARSLLPDWDAVDDVLQDASVIMWQKLSQLDVDHSSGHSAKVRTQGQRCVRW